MNLKMRRVLLLLVTLVVSTLVVVQGHTKLEKSEPANGAALSAAPPHLQLWFNESPDLAVTRIVLVGPAGTVDLSPTHLKGPKTVMAGITGPMRDGKYTASWQTAGDDGHLIKGEIAFTLQTGK